MSSWVRSEVASCRRLRGDLDFGPACPCVVLAGPANLRFTTSRCFGHTLGSRDVIPQCDGGGGGGG